MSEFLCCDQCGELSMFAAVIYVNNKPICTTCQKDTNFVNESSYYDKD